MQERGQLRPGHQTGWVEPRCLSQGPSLLALSPMAEGGVSIRPPSSRDPTTGISWAAGPPVPLGESSPLGVAEW